MNTPRLIILTGPAGAGKNTIAAAYAKLANHCAVIDVDTIRQMLVAPHKAPWEGEEGRAQHELGIRNACALAKNFLENGCNVLVLDVVPEELVSLYRKELSSVAAKVVLLLPTWDEIMRRNDNREQFISDEEIDLLYEWQKNLVSFDEKIDNTELSAEEVARKLLA